MDRSWMYHAPRSSKNFVNGVQTFLNFAFARTCNNGGMIKCPCKDCLNMQYQSRQSVLDHLICVGFRPEYSKWIYHGEGTLDASTSTSLNEDEEILHHEMRDLLNDAFEAEGGGGIEVHEDDLNNRQEMNNKGSNFDNLVKDAEEKVYANCKYNKLSCVVHLYHIKCLNGWSNKSFSMLLEFLKDLLPEGNLLPNTTQQVKKIMSGLGLGYEKIHSCPDGCMLFWDDKEKDEVCSFCGSSRWKVHEANPENEGVPPKNKASKILRWFPLKPRLQRLFMSSKTSNLMSWHHTTRIKDGKLRHPVDGLVWKDFDEKFSEFASDPRNVRLALASDGFNPFRTMNVAHSIWPVFLIPYNLPPWMVMKQPNFILSLIIPGLKGPGNKIDEYTQPLIKELKELWDDGVNTFDASKKQYFQLKAALISTISYFPGYANLSGWSTKGSMSCMWFWGHFLLRHNLDVMHIEKNVCDNIMGTLLGQEGKSKDNYKTRLDLQERGIRKELHLKKRPMSLSCQKLAIK